MHNEWAAMFVSSQEFCASFHLLVFTGLSSRPRMTGCQRDRRSFLPEVGQRVGVKMKV